MAIDSRERRQAAAALSLAHFFAPSVTPNASKDQEWRQEVGFGYPGILADAPPTIVNPREAVPSITAGMGGTTISAGGATATIGLN